MKVYLTEAAFLPALREGRGGVSVAGVGGGGAGAEDEGAVKGCVATRRDGWGSEAVPAPSTRRRQD